MRLICLNVWGGRRQRELIEFLKRSSASTDIFCLQEVMNPRELSRFQGSALYEKASRDLYADICSSMPGFESHVSEPYSDFGESLQTLVSSKIKVTENGTLTLCEQFPLEYRRERISIGSKMQWIAFRHNGKEFTVANVHGIWFNSSKDDNPRRIEQSRRIVEFLSKRKGAKILCGDFNLLPDTESIRMLESGMANLIKKHGIASTRSHLYPKEKPSRFADYAFVSDDVLVKDFGIMDEVVSDHLPLSLGFD